MIGRAMETWDDAALLRVADLPNQSWVFGYYWGGERAQCGCLAHKYYGWTTDAEADQYTGLLEPDIKYDLFRGGGRYENLCYRYAGKFTGLTPPHVITMLRNRARRILARRTLNTRYPEQPISVHVNESIQE